MRTETSLRSVSETRYPVVSMDPNMHAEVSTVFHHSTAISTFGGIRFSVVEKQPWFGAVQYLNTDCLIYSQNLSLIQEFQIRNQFVERNLQKEILPWRPSSQPQ